MAGETPSESWKKLVLRSMPAPAWLKVDAPEGDIVVSTRHRMARNLTGFHFPSHATSEDLRAVMQQIKSAAERSPLKLNPMTRLTEAERDYLLGARLISPDFQHREPGRMALLDEDRVVSVMVNEEDHLRIQALTAGWSPESADHAANEVLRNLSPYLQFMSHPGLGPLTASPANLPGGERRSALFHLIGLGTMSKLPRMLRSLSLMGLTTRGLYGESSRGVAAFIQVSCTKASEADFKGACVQLIREERMARREVRRDQVLDKVAPAVDFAIASKEISLRDALLVIGYVRWAASIDLEGYRTEPRAADLWTATMEFFGTQDPKVAARHRADFLRTRLENLF